MEPSLLMSLFGGQGNNPTISPSSTASAGTNKASTGMNIISAGSGSMAFGVVKIVLIGGLTLYALKLMKGK